MTIGGIVMKLGTNIHLAFRMDRNNFNDPLTFLSSTIIRLDLLTNTFVSDQIPAKLLPFPSASAVLLNSKF